MVGSTASAAALDDYAGADASDDDSGDDNVRAQSLPATPKKVGSAFRSLPVTPARSNSSRALLDVVSDGDASDDGARGGAGRAAIHPR